MSRDASVLMAGRITADSEVSLNESFDDEKETAQGESEKSSAKINFLEDDRSEMTYGRRIALSLMKKSWYYPQANDPGPEAPAEAEAEIEVLPEAQFEAANIHAKGVEPTPGAPSEVATPIEKPSLKKSWAYFEHVALSRYIDEPKNGTRKNICVRAFRKMCAKGDKQLTRAEPGERNVPTRLYSPFWTPHTQLGDFGLGIGLYFSTLRAIAILTFVAGLINLPNILYFASSEYSPAENVPDTLPLLLRGSAACYDQSWVPCPGCKASDWEGNRFARAAENSDLTFTLRNNCQVNEQLGVINYATMILVLIGTLFLAEYLRRQEIQFDEDEQTAQDYSVVVTNPPHDATDPEEWREFFKSQLDARVTVCTVAVHNDILVRTLVERRELLRSIENTLGPGTKMDVIHLAGIAAEQERDRKGLAKFLALIIGGIPEMFARLVTLNAKVQGLAQLDYPVTNVFLIFETEGDQRKVLSKLSVGSLQAARNDHRALEDPKYLFRGQTVLQVSEPDEPNTIRWQDLNAGFLERVKQQLLTAFCTVVAILAFAFLVFVADDASPLGAAFAISGANIIFPIFAKALTSTEAHAAEGLKQTSLYFKIAAFRWANTAIVISIITPFTDTLLAGDGGMIQQIHSLFFAEILTTNGIQLLDPMGHINRHFLAPRAVTQDAMNLKFQGEIFELAERYTNMTKILFLALWYSAIYPGGLFMCAAALFINYYTDRFSLMRTWKRAPHLGTSVSKFSRRYFFSLACVAMAVMSSYYWSGFPYDNLCETESVVSSDYVGNFTIVSQNTTMPPVTIAATDVGFRFCLQNFIDPARRDTGSFPFIESNQSEGDEWMTDDQRTVTTIYGWSSVVVIVIVVIIFVTGWVEGIRTFFRSSYECVGDDMGIPFSQVASVNAYIPQVDSTLYAYPLLATDSDKIDEELYDWEDPDRLYSFYDLTKDADKLLKGLDVSSKVGFSRVGHWPGGVFNSPEQHKSD